MREMTFTMPTVEEGDVWSQEAIDGLVGQHLDFHGQPGVGPVAMCMEITAATLDPDFPHLAQVTVKPHLSLRVNEGEKV
jgi:hypothetical protein